MLSADKEDSIKKDGRRRNSMAFNIMQFMQYEEDDFGPLVDKVRQSLAEQGVKKKR